ncbi:MAG: DinB family protein [Bacteroidota bacterium]|nr:DinB family protein [Bacteroidota bacterium]MDP4244705.1 DinB family protein [Bacteroidota bacterium]MDP4253450.1 DinB family protein [Bacteroidota bacterium]MDP4258952.1 DinB family protein [Bacteroidota bacterium]
MPLPQSILTRLQYQHETVEILIDGMSEELLKKKVHPGKWSPFENIAHLAAYQPVFANRIDRIGAETDPDFERYIAERDPLFPAYLGQSLARLTATIKADRASIIVKIKGLQDDDLQRAGLHPRYGRMTLAQWTEFFLLHEAHHLFTLFMLVRDPQFLPR